jgi:hypothetical protein
VLYITSSTNVKRPRNLETFGTFLLAHRTHSKQPTPRLTELNSYLSLTTAISPRTLRSLWDLSLHPECCYMVLTELLAQLTDWMQHVPKEVLAKNFQTDISAFDHIPAAELYIFPTSKLLSSHSLRPPLSFTPTLHLAPPSPDAKAVSSPQGTVSDPYTFSMSTMPVTKLAGGSVKVVDSSTFKISSTIAAAEVTVNPGGMRELHWHPTQDEWSYFL